MREKFSMPEGQSKKMERWEIEEGLTEYLNSPKSKEGMHPELREFFEIKKSQEPLRRKEIENEAENFVDQNFEKFVPMLTEGGNLGKIVDALGLTNEQIGLLNADYYIKKDEDGKTKIFQKDYEVYSENISSSDLLALAYARDNLRTDTQNEASKVGSGISHRYYLKSQDRYLCENDFGMRVWDEDEGRMVAGNVSDVTPFIQALKYQFVRIQENIASFSRELEQQARNEAEEQTPQIDRNNFENNEDFWEAQRERNTQVQNIIAERVNNALFELQKNSEDKNLLLQSVPLSKFHKDIYWKSDKIARRYSLVTGNPVDDYENFSRDGKKKLDELLKEPTEDERGGSSLKYLRSDFHKKPIIISGDFEKEKAINDVKWRVRETLAYEAVQNDPEMKDMFDRLRCGRGEGSPYFYADQDLYDFIRTVGVNKVNEILESDDRNVSEQMVGYGYLRDMGYDVSRFEPDQLKKQLYEANKLSRSYIWGYLAEREKENIPQNKEADKNWLKAVGRSRSRDLFREGKRMYWLASQVYMQNPNKSEDNRFYYQDSYVDWAKYDLIKADVPEEKLNEYLNSHRNLIVALFGQDSENRYGDREQKGTSATLGLIIQALERGQNLRGVAVANDKQRYLEGVINGEVEDDLEFALKDWPAKWREAVSKEEIALYYEHASDYVLFDPNGLAKYAEWRANTDSKKWEELLNEDVSRKSDLDFRICLGNQNDEIREWYRSGAEYVGNKPMQDYLMRFNATRDTNGQLANWHDTLFWVPNINKLAVAEAKFVLADIQTMNENQEFVQLIPRYNKEKDPFTEKSIQSLRELKKRILAIESNVDLSKFPPELVDITMAPGFNLSALKSMMDRQDFKDLLDGKLDSEQPFNSHKRMFTSRNLADVLQEGLGSRRKNIQGTANSPKKLFSQLNKLVEGKTIGDKKMIVIDLLQNIPTDMEEEVIQLLQEQNVNVGSIIEAQIHAKSDPDGWVSGNYTDCCMPFGSSINTDYMFNPSTQYFTIKHGARIVAQSVVVDGQDRRDNNDVVILDNIEVANNYKKLTPLLSRAYQTFWTEYTSKPVKVGTGYSDLVPPGGVLEENHFSPKAQLGYSDATGSRIYDLPKIKGVESADQIVSFANLTERDAELIAKMEAEAYPEEMEQGKAHILDIIRKQRELEVPGAASSFVVRKGNEPAGYLLVLPEKSEINSDENVAHIYDMVVLPKFQGSNITRKIMQRALDIASAYNVSIEAEARASTSYALLMNKRIQRWIESNGFTLTKNEKLSKYLGREDFYFVRFENIKSSEIAG